MRKQNMMIVSVGVGMVVLWILSACAAPKPAPVPPTATVEVARPSNPGGPGPAATMAGNAQNGAQVFATNCVPCHGAEGKSGINNPGSKDGTVPSLNPIDDTIKNPDAKVFAYNIDLFVEHGSTPDGPNPTLKMLPWGDQKTLTPQQIADVIAYVISLNK